MNIQSSQNMFTIAAIFNFVVAGLLLLVPGLFLQLLYISPGVEQMLWVQLFAGLVLTFGIGYYWISRDPYGNRNLISLGIVGKTLVVAIGLWNVFTGDVSWQFMIPASADAVFAVLFYNALKSLKL